MTRTRLAIRARILGLTMTVVAATTGVAIAGPPLLCHPFDIGTARSLPWDGGNNWRGNPRTMDLATLVEQTQALLTPDTPVIVRMETLRRAGLYAARDAKVATSLFEALQARVGKAGTGTADAMATFDVGYLAETLRQIAQLGDYGDREMAAHSPALKMLVGNIDGYALIQKTLTSRAGDPALEFASALVATSVRRGGTATAHAARAKAGITQDTLLARNIGHLSGI